MTTDFAIQLEFLGVFGNNVILEDFGTGEFFGAVGANEFLVDVGIWIFCTFLIMMISEELDGLEETFTAGEFAVVAVFGGFDSVVRVSTETVFFEIEGTEFAFRAGSTIIGVG